MSFVKDGKNDPTGGAIPDDLSRLGKAVGSLVTETLNAQRAYVDGDDTQTTWQQKVREKIGEVTRGKGGVGK
ncbi:MAG: hypothetical protein ABSD75_24520 [Terriglobales bacterium]